MKLLSALALTALLGTTAAFAQNTATTSPGATGSSTTTESSTTTTTSSTHSSHHAMKEKCKKEAKEKGLSGSEKKQFMKDCEAGKTSG